MSLWVEQEIRKKAFEYQSSATLFCKMLEGFYIYGSSSNSFKRVDLLKFNNGFMEKKADSSDFDRVKVVVGVRRAADLTISQTADLLGFSHKHNHFTENGPRTRDKGSR